MRSVVEGIKNNVLVMPTWDLVKLIQGNRLEVLRNLGVQFISANNDNLIYNKKVFLNFTDNGMNIYIYGSVNTSLNSKYYYGRYVDNQQSINKCLNPLLVNI